jgi:hypothetical protein
MYSLSKKIENVYTCVANGLHSLIVVEKREVLLDNEIIFRGQEYTSANFCSDNFFQFGDSQNFFLGNTVDNNIKKVDYTFNNHTLTSDGGIITKNYRYDEFDKKVKGDYYYLNFENNNEKLLLKDSEWYVTLTFNDEKRVLVRKLNTLKSLSLKTGEYLWEANLDKYSTEREVVGIREFLGIWDNKLIVQMDDSDTIVIIDLETGEIAGEIQHIKSYFPKEGPWGFGWYYHLEGQYAYLLQQNRYLRLDLATQKVETLWIPENANFNIQRVSYDEQYAYFMACDGYHVQTDILGVFDRKALKIVWQYDKPIGSSKPPQSDGNKLYCLDNEGTLHIFEKEKNE